MRTDASIIDQAASLWVQGLTASEIAKRVGITKNAVIGHANRNRDRFPQRKVGGRIPEADLAAMQKLWAIGASKAYIARDLGRNFHTIEDWCRRYRDRFPSNRRRTDRALTVKNEKAPKPVVVAPVVQPIRVDPQEAFRPIPDTMPVRVQDLTFRSCRWPVCDVPDAREAPATHFCGAPKVSGQYCAHHHALSIGPGTRSERRAPEALIKLSEAA